MAFVFHRTFITGALIQENSRQQPIPNKLIPYQILPEMHRFNADRAVP
jgi:hypothetical protein